MRDLKLFVRDLIKKPPQLFPLAALFHIVMLVIIICSDIGYTSLWLHILWMLGYTVFWIFICDMKKWAALGYLALTTINLVLRFTLKPDNFSVYGSEMFIIEVLNNGYAFIH